MKQDTGLHYRDSLRFRLSLAIGVGVLLALFGASLAIGWLTFERDLRQERMRLEGTAAVFASAVSKHVGDQDGASIQKALTGIREFETLEYAVVSDAGGQILAEMGVSTLLVRDDINLSAETAWDLLFRDKIWIDARIVSSGAQVGELRLLSAITHVREAAVESIAINLAITILAAALAMVIAGRLAGNVVRPISTLSAKMLSLARSTEFSQRMRDDGKGEVAILARSFNTMMSQIENRDNQLADYRQNLEDKVEQRTVELRAARDSAEAANAAKSDFLATMSHEIRTPMNGMMVMAQMLAGAPLNARHRRYANVISRSGAGLLNIINDILDFSKIEAGELTLEETSVKIDELVGDVANLFWERANEKSLELAIHVDRDVPTSVIGDPTRFGQVVTNLVNNAMKFTEEGGVTVRVETGDAADGGDGKVKFSVIDTGIGIAREKQADVFGRFTQADQSTTRKYGGTGLGLSICQRLVEAMGGEIGLESAPGKGSTFWFEVELPVEQPPISAPSKSARKPLLLAWPGVLNRAALAAMLGELGHEVTVVDREKPTDGSGRRGVTLLADAPFIERLHREDQVGNADIVCITTLGDSLSDDLIASGRAGDLLRLPVHRSQLAALSVRINDGELLGADALVAQEQQTRQTARFDGAHVLAVDDNPVNREVLRDALGALKVRVTMAENGPDALALLEKSKFDLVFMDCSMPGMDGFEATLRWRGQEAESGRERTPIVALTGHVSGDMATQWRESGMDGYIAKPFTLEDLTEHLSRYCEPSHSQSEEVADTRQDAPAPAQAEPAPAPDRVSQVSEANPVELINPETLAFIRSLGASSSSSGVANKIFGLYRQHSPAAFHQVQDAFDAADAGALAAAAHALKSMSFSAGAGAVARLCQHMEDRAKVGQLPAVADLPDLEQMLARTTEAMAQFVGSQTEPPSSAHAGAAEGGGANRARS